jgi:sugar transferase (PEP-CTERM system associated)
MATLLLALFEMTLLFLVLLGAALLRFGLNVAAAQEYQGQLWPRAALFSAATCGSLLAFGLYSARQRARSVGIIVRAIAAAITGVALTAVCFFVIPSLSIGRGVLALATVGSVLTILAVRLMFTHIVDETVFKRRVVVFGAGKNAASVASLRRRSDRRGFVLVGFIRADESDSGVQSERLLEAEAGLPLIELCRRHEVDEVVVAMDDRRQAFPLRELLDCRFAGIEVTELLTFLERETGRVRIDVLNPSWLIFGEGFKRGELRRLTSRMLDLSASALIVAITTPLMLLTAIAIKLEGGWHAQVLYRQERVGLGGKPFRLLKFRSMRIDAESDGQPKWAQKSDPRVTRVGAIIRTLRVDELPQILNVLRGHMSFVGPRPERPHFVAELAEKIPYYVQRHCVKPGITGWAQLCYPYGSSEQDALEKLQYDLYYIKNSDLLLDLAILVQTVEVVFMGKGAR